MLLRVCPAPAARSRCRWRPHSVGGGRAERGRIPTGDSSKPVSSTAERRRNSNQANPKEHLFGISQGGLVAQRTALRHPQRVRTLTSYAAIPSGVRDSRAQARQVSATWHGPRLRELRVPTLVMHGAQDPLGRPAAGRRIAASVPGARYVELPGTGHDLPRENWPTVVREIRALAGRDRGN